MGSSQKTWPLPTYRDGIEPVVFIGNRRPRICAAPEQGPEWMKQVERTTPNTAAEEDRALGFICFAFPYCLCTAEANGGAENESVCLHSAVT